mmetsp:Transcript_29527/g.89334  ORF Transcript_29527/g.89334 Transcript_29527/m.89334 type:complete len:316 (-) Transcript_29527:140-1087(-)
MGLTHGHAALGLAPDHLADHGGGEDRLARGRDHELLLGRIRRLVPTADWEPAVEAARHQTITRQPLPHVDSRRSAPPQEAAPVGRADGVAGARVGEDPPAGGASPAPRHGAPRREGEEHEGPHGGDDDEPGGDAALVLAVLPRRAALLCPLGAGLVPAIGRLAPLTLARAARLRAQLPSVCLATVVIVVPVVATEVGLVLQGILASPRKILLDDAAGVVLAPFALLAVTAPTLDSHLLAPPGRRVAFAASHGTKLPDVAPAFFDRDLLVAIERALRIPRGTRLPPPPRIPAFPRAQELVRVLLASRVPLISVGQA